jgi:hypothetical protein
MIFMIHNIKLIVDLEHTEQKKNGIMYLSDSLSTYFAHDDENFQVLYYIFLYIVRFRR